jgi:hypothetical protein
MSRFETPDDLLGTLPDLVATEIHSVLPGLRECRGIAGRLDIEALKAKGIRSPAVLVARLRSRQDRTYSGPHHTYRLQMAAFILCKDTLGLSRDLAAANIAQVLMRIIPENQWKQPDHLHPAELVAEEPLVSAASGAAALALTAVTWEQVIAVSPFETPEAIAPQVYLGQFPDVGADHDADYQQIGAGT